MLQLLTPVSVRINGHRKKGVVRGRWVDSGVEFYDVLLDDDHMEKRVERDRIEVLGAAPPVGGGKVKEPL